MKQGFPAETQGPFEAGHTPAGKPAVYGSDDDKPICTVHTDSDAHMISAALNFYRSHGR